VSPGEVLHEEFLVELGINQRALALAIDVPPIRISEIVRRKRAIVRTDIDPRSLLIELHIR